MIEEEIYQEMRKIFQDKFFNELYPLLQQYDNERKLRLVIAIIFVSIFSIAGLLIFCMIILWDAEGHNRFEILKGSIFMFTLAWLVWFGLKKGFENKIKNKIMPKFCACFDKLTWVRGSYPDGDEVFISSHLLPLYTSCNYDDVFYGEYKYVKFDIVESKSGVNSNKSGMIFDGVVVKFDMNKSFKGNTVICPDSLLPMAPAEELIHTPLEDVVFEKKFDVYTDDEVEARYLITPSFMERLNNMKVAFEADKVSCAFYGTNLFVALHTRKDLFSICSLLKPVNDGKQFFQMFEEILSIIKLIDHFKLDQKIGL